MRCLVTGAAGFIGSHLCEFLLQRGADVIGVDNVLTGSLENLVGCQRSPRFTFIRRDVTRRCAFEGPFDWVLHFASPASPADYSKFPIETLTVGAVGTHNTLELARAKRAAFLVASTSQVYGDPLMHPQPEHYWGNVNPVGPRAVYDEAKRFAEAMTMAYERCHGLNTRIIRIFNTYGPRMRLTDGRAIPAFFTQALRHEPVTVFGDGSQTRSFQYISDLVEGVWSLMQRRITDPVNIGNPEEMTLLDLAKEIIRITASRSPIIFRPLPRDDPKVRRPDITRARQLLGWEPRVGLEEGLARTHAWFRGKLRDVPVRVASA